MSFECRNAEDLNSSCFRHKIIKLSDKSIVENYLFISKSINFNLPPFLIFLSIIGLLFGETHVNMKPLALQTVC